MTSSGRAKEEARSSAPGRSGPMIAAIVTLP